MGNSGKINPENDYSLAHPLRFEMLDPPLFRPLPYNYNHKVIRTFRNHLHRGIAIITMKTVKIRNSFLLFIIETTFKKSFRLLLNGMFPRSPGALIVASPCVLRL